MTETIRAFSLPLGPAQPGLTDNQMKNRKAEAHRIVRAAMPSSAHLMNSVLQERIESDGRMLWLAFDLIETPQMELMLTGKPDSLKHGLKSALGCLYAELERLREEAELTVIRVGELAEFSARLGTLSTQELANAIDSLSERDLNLWRLINSRKGKRISIVFPSAGSIGISMPLFPMFIPEKQPREIQFNVVTPTREKAEIRLMRSVDETERGIAVRLPRKIHLFRQSAHAKSRSDGWFLLYAAEYRGLPVKAKVRAALRMSDLSPSHLELLEISEPVPEAIKDILKDIYSDYA